VDGLEMTMGVDYFGTVLLTMLLLPFLRGMPGARIVNVSSPEVEGVSGRYFVRERPAEVGPNHKDRTLQKELWELTMELTGLA
jgi:NAD(P)-dependent dehydrogenase (short-subunit alcohol dehydrogenase family)